MSRKTAAEWEEEFKDKEDAFFETLSQPEGMNLNDFIEYKTGWQQVKWARAAARRERETQDLLADAEARIERITAKMAGKSLLPAEAEKQPSAPTVAPPRLALPPGDAAQLIEHQLATCAALIGSIAEHTHRTMNLDSMIYFADRIASLMKASASAAKVVARLRSDGPEETRHRIVIERAEPKVEGGGVLRT